ncbi:MAG TPA: DNA-processing protein DprA [Bauldia sp.]|nr:DNA-processing protein DprA [Bauldia sp.]
MTARNAIVLTDAQRLDWLRLIRTPSIGPVTFRELLNHFGSASAALDALPHLLRRAGKAFRVTGLDDAERELAAAAKAGARFFAMGESGYPEWLRAIDGAPPLLAVRGDGAIADLPAVGIVGSRNASVAGRKIAAELAAGLGASGFVIVSGLARGIDAAAHRAALPTGTMAAFAGGLDRPYPAENMPLAEEIVAAGGCLVSEMPMGHEPRAKDFPRRNRLISGMSLAVVIVEAALRSGSLITARLAAEQGRLVFAVPGSPLDPRAGGTNRLIRDGATIVTSVEEIVADLMPMLGREPPPQDQAREPGAPIATDATDDERSRVIEALGPTPVEIDEIIRFTSARAAAVRLVLIELDLAGRIEHHPGGRVSLTG